MTGRILPDLRLVEPPPEPPQRKRGRPPGGGRRVTMEAVKACLARGLTIAEVAVELNCSRGAVENRRREAGLVKKRGEFRSQARGSRHKPKSIAGASVAMPAFDHPALSEMRTLFPSTVAPVEGANSVLVDGMNSWKIGAQITKGRWRGFRIYTVTLQERATCPTSCAVWRSCVVPETRVITADLRWVAIESLQIGQRIIGFDEFPAFEGEERKMRTSTVEQLGRATLPCFQINTTRGSVIASADHLWMSRPKRRLAIDPNFHYQWRRTDDLSPGETILHLAEPWEQDTSYDAGRLRGFIEGEGYVSTWGNNGYPKTSVGWSQRPGKLLEEINTIAEEKGFEIITRRVSSGVNGTDMALVDVRGGWRESLRFLGTFRPSRLMNKAEDVFADHAVGHGNTAAAQITSIVPVGEREVVTIQTSTRTMITEGLLSHNCYGNSMHLARRLEHGPALEERLFHELAVMQSRHPGGFAVRLHVLGDFYSVEYVELWRSFLARFPALHVFGFSARHDPEDPIAAALSPLIAEQWDRFAIRMSNAPMYAGSTVTIEHPLQKPPDAIVCPQQIGKTASCATCALCWQSRKRIAFLRH